MSGLTTRILLVFICLVFQLETSYHHIMGRMVSVKSENRSKKKCIRSNSLNVRSKIFKEMRKFFWVPFISLYRFLRLHNTDKIQEFFLFRPAFFLLRIHSNCPGHLWNYFVKIWSVIWSVENPTWHSALLWDSPTQLQWLPNYGAITTHLTFQDLTQSQP